MTATKLLLRSTFSDKMEVKILCRAILFQLWFRFWYFFLFKIDLLCGSTCKSNGYLIVLLRMSYVNVNQVKKSSICRTIVVTFFTLKFLDVSYLKYFISILIYRFNWYGYIVYIFILKWNMNMFSHLQGGYFH